jgi:hypothetical protein
MLKGCKTMDEVKMNQAKKEIRETTKDLIVVVAASKGLFDMAEPGMGDLMIDVLVEDLLALKSKNTERKCENQDAALVCGHFGQALRAVKRGKKIARVGWNGRNQYVELATNISYRNADGEVINAKHQAIGNAALAFVGTSGVQVGWLASQADMLADDWIIVE